MVGKQSEIGQDKKTKATTQGQKVNNWVGATELIIELKPKVVKR